MSDKIDWGSASAEPELRATRRVRQLRVDFNDLVPWNQISPATTTPTSHKGFMFEGLRVFRPRNGQHSTGIESIIKTQDYRSSAIMQGNPVYHPSGRASIWRSCPFDVLSLRLAPGRHDNVTFDIKGFDIEENEVVVKTVTLSATSAPLLKFPGFVKINRFTIEVSPTSSHVLTQEAIDGGWTDTLFYPFADLVVRSKYHPYSPTVCGEPEEIVDP